MLTRLIKATFVCFTLLSSVLTGVEFARAVTALAAATQDHKLM